MLGLLRIPHLTPLTLVPIRGPRVITLIRFSLPEVLMTHSALKLISPLFVPIEKLPMTGACFMEATATMKPFALGIPLRNRFPTLAISTPSVPVGVLPPMTPTAVQGLFLRASELSKTFPIRKEAPVAPRVVSSFETTSTYSSIAYPASTVPPHPAITYAHRSGTRCPLPEPRYNEPGKNSFPPTYP